MSHSFLPTSVLLFTFVAAAFAQTQSDTKSEIETQPRTAVKPQGEPQRQESSRSMFDFSAKDFDQWEIVNDRVMGGRSSSKAAMIEGDKMKFSGNLSLENNGGFASVRSITKPLGLKQGDMIKLRVKGDGRKYTFNLFIPTQQVAFSYQKDFATTAGEWTEITLKLSEFQATSFGQKIDRPMDPAKVNSVGVLLADKKEGVFNIMIDWIKVGSES